MDIGEVRKNSKLLINGVPFNVEDADFVKPGKGRAIYRLKLRNLLEGSLVEHTYHSGEKAEEAHLDTAQIQYLYKEGDHYMFMNTENFEQFPLSEANLGERMAFIKEGTVVEVLMMGDKPIDVNLPNFVELKIVESAVSTKTDSVTSQNKSAVLETGYNILVPSFIKEGDVIKIDTRTGTYVERVPTRK